MMATRFDFTSLLDKPVPPRSANEWAEEAAWLWLEREDWVPTPELFFAMKQVIQEQMAGG